MVSRQTDVVAMPFCRWRVATPDFFDTFTMKLAAALPRRRVQLAAVS